MPEEHQPPAKSLAMEPLDFRSLTSDVACRSNDGGAMLPLDPAGLWVLINIRPDALAQVLDREGVVALAVEYRDDRSLYSVRTSTHKRTVPSSFPECKSLKTSPRLLG